MPTRQKGRPKDKRQTGMHEGRAEERHTYRNTDSKQ